ncbi:MAG: efflux RND transporter periplasmic adaptor subunit [Planctomycetota bacterium]|nr:MAG: efflux RND transporter periplasmic adaptor subunit [Planctomycetota bacterium]
MLKNNRYFGRLFRRRIIFSLLLASAVALSLAAGCKKATPKQTVEKPKKVAVQVLEPSLIEDRITLPGEVVALRSVFLAAESPGRVEWIKTRGDGSTIEGSDVAKGEELVRIDARLSAALLKQAQAGLELANAGYHVQAKLALELANQGLVQAAAAYELANATYARKAALEDMGSASTQDLDRARMSWIQSRSAYESALLGFQAAQAGHEAARLLLVQAGSALTAAELAHEKATITSPFAGVVADVPVEIGAYLSSGKRVVHLISIDRVKVIVQVPESDIGRVTPEEPLLVRIPALKSLAINGSITRMPDTADQMTRTFPVEITIENPGRLIKPGMIAKVDFVLERVTDAIVVPINAILPVGEDYFVFVAKRDDSGDNARETFRARRRKVSLGIMREETFQIKKGLEAGDLLIVKGQQSVIEGQELEILEGLPGTGPGKAESAP